MNGSHYNWSKSIKSLQSAIKSDFRPVSERWELLIEKAYVEYSFRQFRQILNSKIVGIKILNFSINWATHYPIELPIQPIS